VDFDHSPRSLRLQQRLLEFMERSVYPAEPVYAAELVEAGDPNSQPQVMEELKAEARGAGLWNLFLPDEQLGAGLSCTEYAPLAEILGRSRIASEACNCSAPDTGNMELLHMFGSEAQKRRWLEPLLGGEIRSAFAMTEPGVAGSDATNIEMEIGREGEEWVLNGRKWWTTNALHPACVVLIVMGKTSPQAAARNQQSMVLVPIDTPGLELVRGLRVFGYEDQEGHGEFAFDDVRVPVENLLGDEGAGFAIAQARLGPGRVHHCMRVIGLAERALEALCRRALSRTTFGAPLSERANVQDWIAEARIELEMARLLVLRTAWTMDRAGNRAARRDIAAIKVAVPEIAQRVIDRAIQVHGGAGVSQDFPLADAFAHVRTLRLADGPDEVHKRTIAREELRSLADL
jgi:acyl-CoA dehydrogenase